MKRKLRNMSMCVEGGSSEREERIFDDRERMRERRSCFSMGRGDGGRGSGGGEEVKKSWNEER